METQNGTDTVMYTNLHHFSRQRFGLGHSVNCVPVRADTAPARVRRGDSSRAGSLTTPDARRQVSTGVELA